jgi:predicted nucleotidyltransferase
VRSQRVGQAFTYQLNHDHLSAAHIVGLARIQDTLLSRIRHELGSWEVPAVYAAVFGSVARGTMTPDSDLDLLLIRSDDDARWETQVHELVTAVANWVGNDTRPLEFTATEVAARGRDEPVLREIVRDGLTVAGTRTWLAAQLRKGRR